MRKFKDVRACGTASRPEDFSNHAACPLVLPGVPPLRDSFETPHDIAPHRRSGVELTAHETMLILAAVCSAEDVVAIRDAVVRMRSVLTGFSEDGDEALARRNLERKQNGILASEVTVAVLSEFWKLCLDVEKMPWLAWTIMFITSLCTSYSHWERL